MPKFQVKKYPFALPDVILHLPVAIFYPLKKFINTYQGLIRTYQGLRLSKDLLRLTKAYKCLLRPIKATKIPAKKLKKATGKCHLADVCLDNLFLIDVPERGFIVFRGPFFSLVVYCFSLCFLGLG